MGRLLQALPDGLRDMLGIDSRRPQEFGGRAGGRYGAHRQFDHRGGFFHHTDEGIQNGVADPALRPVIFHHHEPAPVTCAAWCRASLSIGLTE